MSQAVTVNTTGGAPTIGIGFSDPLSGPQGPGVTLQHNATYVSGSGTNTLTFKYTVTDADFDWNGLSIVENSLALNGGTMRSTVGADAELGNSFVDNNSAYRVDTIDLGSDGLLIRGNLVDNKWFYYWNNMGIGQPAAQDGMNHDVLDAIFNRDINGVVNTMDAQSDGKFGTTDVYRYGTLNGLQLALPTVGTPMTGNLSGTAVSGAGQINNTYNDLAAVWDAFNGTGTGTGLAGSPVGWHSTATYWGADVHANGNHRTFSPNGGVTSQYDETPGYAVALQVL
jgi:hypothetical protein